MAARVFRISCLAAVCGIFAGQVAVGDQPTVAIAVKPKSAAKPRITISKATTFFTQPVGKDGYIDYVAALNRHYGKGVTPKNNAAVPLFRAFGPKEISKALRKQFFKRLGIKPLPEKEPYISYLYLGKGLKGRAREKAEKRWFDQFDKALDGPWKRAQCPDIAKWLDANEGVLELIEQTSRRPKFYMPFIVDGKGMQLQNSFSPIWASHSATRRSIRMLIMRANFHVDAGQIDQATSDLLTGHRLARVIEKGSFFLTSGIVASLEGVISTSGWRLAQSGKLTAAQAIAFRKKLDAIGPFVRMPEIYDITERCYSLESMVFQARHWKKTVASLEEFKLIPKGAAKKLDGSFEDFFEIDAVLRDINQWFDRVVAVAKIRDPLKRSRAIRKLNDQFRGMKRNAQRLPDYLTGQPLKRGDRLKASKWLVHVWVAFRDLNPGYLLRSEDRANTHFDFTCLAFALAAFRADRGKYPAALALLLPKYINAVSADRFTGKPLQYKLTPSGYLLYSVGPNGNDDGGQRNGQNADDIAVRTP